MPFTTRARALLAICLLAAVAVATGCDSSGTAGERLTVAVGPGQAQTVRELFAHGPAPMPRFVPLPPPGAAGLAVARQERIDLVIGDSDRDFTSLEASRVVPRHWDSDSFYGLLATGLTVIAVRPGNPLHITSWNALGPYARQVVLADPRRTTEGRAGILGAFGGSFRDKSERHRGLSVLRALVHTGVVRPDPAAAQRAFAAGRGVAWITTEARAREARASGVPLTLVIPTRTMELDVPIAIARTAAHRDAAQAAMDALRDPVHQRLLARFDLRPVLDGLRDPRFFPSVFTDFTVQRFGGWKVVDRRFATPCTLPVLPPDVFVHALCGR